MRRLLLAIPLLLLAGCADDAAADCPGAEPAHGSACAAGPAICYYGADTCRCTNGAWQCGGADLSATAHDMTPPPTD